MLAVQPGQHQFFTNNRPTFLGTGPRPRDPNEDKYHLITGLIRPSIVSPASIDLSQTYSLAAWMLPDGTIIDCRPDIQDQMRLGSCAAWAAVKAVYMACRAAGMAKDTADRLLHAGVLYALVRKVEKSFPTDAGSYPADNCDILCNAGVQWLADAPYDGSNAADDYPQLAQIATHVLAASHHGFFPTDGKTAEDFARSYAASIASGLPVILAMTWCNEFFNPTRGVLPKGCTPATSAGGHAIDGWQWHGPSQTFNQSNQWSPAWAADAASSGIPNMRAGDFAIPIEYAAPNSGIIFEGRAVVSNYSAPVPTPPNPNPPSPPNPPEPPSPPTPPNPPGPRDPRVDVQGVINDYSTQFAQHPRSTSLRYELKGAQRCLQAVS